MNRSATLKQDNLNHKSLKTSCNLCTASDGELLATRDREGHKNFKVLCSNCGLIYSNSIPSLEELEIFYQQGYERKFNNVFVPKSRRVYRSALRAVYRYNRIKHYLSKGIKILDTSACMGEFVYLLEQKGYETLGIEHNHHFIKYAKEEIKINLENHFLDRITLSPNSFDIITAHHILNLYVNPFEVLKKYYGFLKENGILNIEVPNINARHIAPYSRFRLKHFYNFNLYTIEMLARNAGFKVINTILIPESMHINMILKKDKPFEGGSGNIQNYINVRNSIMGYKSLNFLISPLPYLKAFSNAKKYLALNKNVKKYSCGKEILDSCFANIPAIR